MPQGNLVEVLGREVRQGLRGELMVESSPSRQRRPPCKTNKEMSEENVDSHQNNCERRRPYSSTNTLMHQLLRGGMYSHRMLAQSLKNSNHQQGLRMVTKPKQLNLPKQPRRH